LPAWKCNNADLPGKITYADGNDGSLGECVTTSYLPQVTPAVVSSLQNPTPTCRTRSRDAAANSLLNALDLLQKDH
jgi:hypothetical protein